VAVSGAFGPLVVASAYFLATPKLVGAQADEQLSAFLVAPYAVIAGLAGSVLLAAIWVQREQRTALRAATAGMSPVTAPDPVPATPKQAGAGYDDDLADDGYAPAGAFSTTSTPALTGAGTGETKTPLWPEAEATTETKPGKGRKR
jgi:hypothetical protein